MNFVLSFTQTKEKYIPYFREFMKKICFRRNYSWKYGKLPNRQFTFYFFGRTNPLNFRNFCHFIEEFYMTVILCRIICQIFLNKRDFVKINNLYANYVPIDFKRKEHKREKKTRKNKKKGQSASICSCTLGI